MRFLSIDVETANRSRSSICQIGGCLFENGREIDRFCWLVNPEVDFDMNNVRVHGIDENRVCKSARFSELADDLGEWLADEAIITHSKFDGHAIHAAFQDTGSDMKASHWIDSAELVKRAWPTYAQRGYGLKDTAKRLGISFRHHDALEDARTAGLIAMAAMSELNINVAKASQLCRYSPGETSIGRVDSGKRRSAMEVVIPLKIDIPSLETHDLLRQIQLMQLAVVSLSQSIAAIILEDRAKAIAEYEAATVQLRQSAIEMSELALKIAGGET